MTKLLKRWGRAAAGLRRHRAIVKHARELRGYISEVEKNYSVDLARDLSLKLDALEAEYEGDGGASDAELRRHLRPLHRGIGGRAGLHRCREIYGFCRELRGYISEVEKNYSVDLARDLSLKLDALEAEYEGDREKTE